jgi:glucosyl-3-phosphoglycerate synthase
LKEGWRIWIFQNGAGSVLHRLGAPNVETVGAGVHTISTHQSIASILPCLHSELEASAPAGILEQIKRVTYLNEIVVAIGHASAIELRRARVFQSSPATRTARVDRWARAQDILKTLVEREIDRELPVKG